MTNCLGAVSVNSKEKKYAVQNTAELQRYAVQTMVIVSWEMTARSLLLSTVAHNSGMGRKHAIPMQWETKANINTCS